jgi:p-aminobenzoyl-glutamate transporter AbgT
MTTPAAAPPASTKTDTEDETAAEEQGGGFQRVLNLIERIGNKVPNPAILFLALCVATIVFSQILYLVNAHVTTEVVQPPPHSVQQEYVGGSVLPAEVLPGEQSPASSYHVVHETVRVQGLLTIPGIRYLFTSVISNFMGFTALGIILVIMVGVGVAEIAGLISSLIRKLPSSRRAWSSPGSVATTPRCSRPLATGNRSMLTTGPTSHRKPTRGGCAGPGSACSAWCFSSWR